MEKPEKIFEELKKAVEPISRFLKDNFNPHCHVVVSAYGARVVSDELHIPFTQHADSDTAQVHNAQSDPLTERAEKH